MTSYAKRWEIEDLFACLKKGGGFNLGDTHLTHLDRVSLDKLGAFSAIQEIPDWRRRCAS